MIAIFVEEGKKENKQKAEKRQEQSVSSISETKYLAVLNTHRKKEQKTHKE